MSFRIQGKIEGLGPLLEKLTAFRGSVRRKVLRSAMRKSASIVNKLAKSLVAQRTGQLKRSIGVKVKAYQSGVVIGVVEPRSGFKIPNGISRIGKAKFIDPRIYAILVERGTRPHFLGKGSDSRKKSRVGSGRMHPGAKAQPFLYPAFTQSEGKIVATFEAEIEKELAKL